MKANELRIGNMVYDEDAHFEIIAIMDGEDIDYAETRRPIPLTEEWLLKLGFEVETGWYKNFTPCGKGFLWKEGYVIFCGTTVEAPILHVHQLQNLYFALTGEELTTKH